MLGFSIRKIISFCVIAAMLATCWPGVSPSYAGGAGGSSPVIEIAAPSRSGELDGGCGCGGDCGSANGAACDCGPDCQCVGGLDCQCAGEITDTSVKFIEDEGAPGSLTAVFTLDGGAAVSALGIVAVYDARGALRDMASVPIAASVGDVTVERIKITVPSGCAAKAFLWEATTFAPLCDAAFAISPEDKTSVTYTAEQAGGESGVADSSEIVITFSEPVTGFSAEYIAVENADGAVVAGELTEVGDGVWTLELNSVLFEGDVVITVGAFDKYRVTDRQKTVAVYKSMKLLGQGWSVLRENDRITVNPDTAGDGGSVSINMRRWADGFGDVENFVTRSITSERDLGGATDFTITAKVSGGLSADYQAVGIAAHMPGDTGSIITSLRRRHSFFGGSTGNRNFGVMCEGGSGGGESYTGDARGDIAAWLKLEKKGETYSAYYSYANIAYDAASGDDPESQWVPCASGASYTRTHADLTNSLASDEGIGVGFFASSGGADNAIDATVSDFKLNGVLIPVSGMMAIRSVPESSSLTASVGADFSELALPATVKTILADGVTSYTSNVAWNRDGYDPNSTEPQTIYGELETPASMNTLDLKASITVTLSDSVLGIDLVPQSDTWIWPSGDKNRVAISVKAERVDGFRDIDPSLCVWTSLNPDAATVDANGVVTAVAEGFAAIECEYPASSLSATVDIVVGSPQGKVWRLSSPSDTSEIRFKLSDDGVLSYASVKNGKYALDFSDIGLVTNVGDFSGGLTFIEANNVKSVDETYSTLSGKFSEYQNVYNERTISFEKGAARYSVVARAYDDSVAFRHSIAADAPDFGDLTISDEPTFMNIPQGSTIWTTLRTGVSFEYQSRYDEYTTDTLGSSQNSAGKPVFPVLYKTPKTNPEDEDLYGLLHEAHLSKDYLGSTLQHAGGGLMRLIFDLNQENIGPVKASSTASEPWVSPWRVIINGSLEEIVETMTVENLNPAPDEETYKFSEWVEPGLASWSWVNFYGGQAIKQNHLDYIDLAAQMGWKYYILDEGWQPRVRNSGENAGELYLTDSGGIAAGVAPFYGDENYPDASYRSKPALSGPNAGGYSNYDGRFDWFSEVKAHAEEKGVELIAWVHSRDMSSEEWMRKRLSEWSSLGIKGIKTDFFYFESQERMLMYEELFRIAAEYGMLVNVHGSNKPTGEMRTWPNNLAREAIDGQESGGLNAFQYAISPFSRGAVGTADITEQVSRDTARATHGFQIALSVMFENGMHSLGSGPSAYLNDPIIYSLYKNFPARWSEVEFIDGDVAQYASLARKAYGSDDWYACTISNVGGTKQTTSPSFDPAFTFTSQISTDYLDEGESYYALIYREKERENPAQGFRNALQMDIRENVRKGDVISVPIQPSGGCVVVFKKTLPLIEGLDVENKNITVKVDDYYQIPVIFKNPDTASLRELVCVSDDENVATVSSDGLILGVNTGTAKITVSPRIQAPGSDIKVELTVTVDPPAFSLAQGWTVTRRNKDFSVLSQTSVKIRSASGNAEDPEGSALPAQNVVLKEFQNNADWEAVVKISGGLNANYQTAGLIAFVDSKTLGVASRRRHSMFGTHCFCFRTPSSEWRVDGNDILPNDDAYLRLVKTGDTIKASYSYDGVNFTPMSAEDNAYAVGSDETIKLGLIATNGNGMNECVDVVFSDFMYKTSDEAEFTVYPFAIDNYGQ